MTDNTSADVAKAAGKSAEEGAREFKWTFQRLGGLDQVILQSAGDLRRLRELDPKLWVALSCPASGLEFDSRTLSLIDKDRDGRIRIPEILDAVEWISARLKDPAVLINAGESLPLDAIDDATDEGRRLIATGRAILRNLGKDGEGGLTQEDVSASAAHASENTFNGDGILPPLPAFEQDVRDFIADAMAVTGAVEDASGQAGIDRPIADAFVGTLAKWLDWRKSADSAEAPIGRDTPEAWGLLSELREKIDDYFLRCELVSYAPEAKLAVGIDDKFAGTPETGILDSRILRELPISRVEANRPLDFTSGLNPAWRERVERFALLVKPLLRDAERLTREDWEALLARFGPYDKALASKPAPETANVVFPPTSSVDKLGEERIRAILDSGVAKRFAELAAQDADVPAAAGDISRMERMVLYHKHLYRLLTNFVSFEEFFNLKRNAAFQAGTLYIDGRACRLCALADKVEEHSALAANSQLYLLYCACERGRKPDKNEPAERMGIVAVVTAGDADLLMPNRNGVFVDNKGRDWDAAVVKIVSNPIGLWQAIWNPYKKFGNMITEQIGKFANDKQSELFNTAGQKLGEISTSLTAPAPAAAPQKFDIGRNIGIFAAVGIALGALGTAVGSIARALFAMEWWQFPVLILGLFAIVSGPSLLIAWLKLRQRTLGPLLEASGWAINGKVAINYTLSRKLTSTATLPPNSERSKKDPLRRIYRWRLIILVLGIVIGGLLWFGLRGRRSPVDVGRPAGAAAVVSQSQPGEQKGVLEEMETALQSLGKTMETAAQTPAVAPAVPAAAPAPAAP